jgi:hypothetical protein
MTLPRPIWTPTIGPISTTASKPLEASTLQALKYLSPEYQHRSRIFRPKTRSIIRKNEAAAAAALFSNMEVADFTPGNPDDPNSVASTAALKEVVEYRMRHSIPAFEVCIGGIQDAQTQGAVISFQYWECQTKNGKRIKDKPCIELRPIENIRIDGGALWHDPVNTSPYFFDILPMYVCDVKAMMNSKDDKTGQPKWKKLDDKIISKARPDRIDTTRQARLGKQQDPHQEESTISAFDVVWVFRVFMKDENGDDYTYYTLGTEELLTDPKPREEVYHNAKNERPYVMGYAILETHKVLKTSVPTLIKPLQQETNEIRNQRIDNVKFVLNKRWIVARGRQVDVQSLVRNVPGGVTLATDPKNDVQESNWADVTSSAYVEEDRINADLDDVAGNFSPSTKVANNAINDTLGGSKMAAMGAGLMTDYLLRTIMETWWEKVIRQVVTLEQYYEDDEIILAICANKARLFPRFGISKITDDLLMNEVHVAVNVGMGASNPTERLQKFLAVTNAAIELANTAPPGFNVPEALKELYSHAGYRDGTRFFGQQDPRLLKAMGLVQQVTGLLKDKKLELAASNQIDQAKIASSDRQKAAQLQVDAKRIQGDLDIRAAELVIERQRLELEKLQLRIQARQLDTETAFRNAEVGNSVEEARLKLDGEHKKIAGQVLKIAADLEKAHLDIEKAKAERDNEGKVAQVAGDVAKSMVNVGAELKAINTALADATKGRCWRQDDVQSLQQGMGILAVTTTKPKKKATGFKLKKDGKKTKGVVVSYDDGSEEHLGVTETA